MFCRILRLCSGGASNLTPSEPRTSADPERLLAARFPCFATGMPQDDVTIAVVVDILKVFALSPPVPTISRHSILCKSLTQCFLMPTAQAVISSMVSPLTDIAVKKAAN